MSDSPKAVFLSYASEDADAARRIAEALRAAGVEVWFDQSELVGGDAWDTKIRGQIAHCGLFVPIISANAQARLEGYFRLEWKLAVQRMHTMAEEKAFLFPLVIDETRDAEAKVPVEFKAVQWTRLPGGEGAGKFCARVAALLGGPVAADRGLVTPPPAAKIEAGAAGDSARPARRRPLVLATVALAIVGAVGLALFVFRPPERPVVAPPPAAEPPAPAVAPKPADKSVAVLPFANMSDDKENAFFTEGVHEDIVTNLALIRELRITSRTSVQSYRGTAKPMKQIAAELGVSYILEGSVRRVGNKVRVTGQLIHAATDEHVWAQTYDRDLTDIFTIQSEISRQIAGSLKAALSPEERNFIARRPTDNPVAYDAFLRGRDLFNRTIPGSSTTREIEAFYKKAIELDPNFAAAWGELAVIHAQFAFYGRDASAGRLAQADAAIAQAIRLAPDAPDVVRTVGTYAYYAYRDYARATAQYEKLARLQPNDPTVYFSLGLIQRRQGRWAESLVNMRRAVELDPGNISYTRSLFASLFRLRRWDEGIALQQRIIELLPGQLDQQLQLADFRFGATGSFQAADELLARLPPAERDSPIAIYFRRNWAGFRGDFAEFKRLDQLQPSFEREGTSGLGLADTAAVYLAMGETAAIAPRLVTALAEWRGQLEREPGNLRALSNISRIEALLGNREEARRLAEQVMELMPESRDTLDGAAYRYYLAWVHGVNGDTDRAIEELSRLMRNPAGLTVNEIRVHPAFKKLRGDPRFEALMNDPKNRQPLF